MIPVAERLARLPHVHHTIYADDITLWVSRGTNGHIEESLQEAICEIEACLKNTGLRCSPQKSELLILPPPGHRRKEAEREAGNITLRTENGTTIPHVRSLRVLGLHIDSGNTNHTALDKFCQTVGEPCSSAVLCAVRKAIFFDIMQNVIKIGKEDAERRTAFLIDFSTEQSGVNAARVLKHGLETILQFLPVIPQCLQITSVAL